MTDPFDRPLHGVSVYNPDLLSKQELIRLFVARQAELDRLTDALRRENEGPAQHHLLVGRRGMGKTTLLRRLRYVLEDDAELSQIWLGLNFPEEQYNVGDLSDFWLNCVDALADTLEARGQAEHLRDLDAAAVRLQGVADEATRRAEALALLLRMADRLNRRLVLLVDNVDLILDRLKKEEWALRDVLSAEPRLVLIGATSAGLESSYSYEAAFYDFFRVHVLEGLNDAETLTVMRQLADGTGNAAVRRVLDEDPGRVRTIRLLSGGNPRTIVLLYTLLAQGGQGDVRTDLERLLDQCTPLYKHRFEELPVLSQRVVDTLAVNWHPMTAGEAAQALRMEVNLASSQLNRLVKAGVVEKVKLPDTRRLGFQISERFFNIWYLMRASRRVRRRLTFLVEFLRLMFAPEDLAQRGRRHLSSRGTDPVRHAEFGLALAETVNDASLRGALETASLQTLCADPELRLHLDEMFDFEAESPELRDKAERIRVLSEAREAVRACQRPEPDWDAEAFWDLLGGSSIPAPEKLMFASALPALSPDRLSKLSVGLRDHQNGWRGLLSPTDLDALRTAIREGSVTAEGTPADFEAAAKRHNSPNLAPIGFALSIDWGRDIDIARFTQCLPESRSILVRCLWGRASLGLGAPAAEIAAGLDAVDLGAPWSTWMMRNMADLFVRLGCFEMAEEALRQAISRDGRAAAGWNDLANLLVVHLGRYSEAEHAYRQAIALDAQSAHAWNGLGNVLQDHLGRYEESERAYRQAIALDEHFAIPWNGLGHLLQEHLGRYEEAEHAYRRSIALNEHYPDPWTGLGKLLHDHLGRSGAGERAFRQAIEIAPQMSVGWNCLAWWLFRTAGDQEEALRAGREAIRLNPEDVDAAHTLACILVAAGDWNGARPFAQQFLAAGDDYHQKIWPDILVFFAETVRAGLTQPARELLADLQMIERWQPIDLALRAAAEAGTECLGRVAPELRQAAELVLKEIAPELL